MCQTTWLRGRLFWDGGLGINPNYLEFLYPLPTVDKVLSISHNRWFEVITIKGEIPTACQYTLYLKYILTVTIIQS